MNERENTFIILTPKNLRWFWSKYTYNHKLTDYGTKLLFKIMMSSQYDFFMQPEKIQNRIREMLHSNSYGKKLLEKIGEQQMEVYKT